MDHRSELFSKWQGISNLAQYNRAADETLPEIPVFLDEFLLLADDKAIAGSVKSLSAGGRKFGLYLIASSQVWNASEISTAIRSNLSTTVQFNARDKAQSRVLLSDSSAYEITRPGEARAILPGQAGLIALMGPDPANLIEVEPKLLSAGPDFFAAMRPMPAPAEAAGPKPTEKQQSVLDLFDAGEQSLSAIARQVYGGSAGGAQVILVRNTLEKFGRGGVV
jgi:hypothetical protein